MEKRGWRVRRWWTNWNSRSNRADVEVPLVRDLAVDRQFMFESLKRVKAWIRLMAPTIWAKDRACRRKFRKRAIRFRIASLAELPGSLPAGE